MALVAPHPPVITAYCSISAGGSFLTLIVPPVADGSRQNDTLTGWVASVFEYALN